MLRNYSRDFRCVPVELCSWFLLDRETSFSEILLEKPYYGMNRPGQVQFLKVCFRPFEVVGFLLNVDEVRAHFFMMFYFEGTNSSYSIARAGLFVG